MASADECEAALHRVAALLAEVDPEVRGRYLLDRSVSCRVPDLDLMFGARVSGDGITDIVRVDDGDAQVRVTVGSDDLLALATGELSAARAWTTGRLRVAAGVTDMMRIPIVLAELAVS